MMQMKEKRFLLSGGGTGGHIFPAISIAGEIKHRWPDARILFVGAKNRMEMTQVPAAGFDIIGLPITGLRRSLSVKNLILPIKLIYSLLRCFSILLKFKPSAVIGTGGFASAPVVIAAGLMRLPVFVQEQNSFAGLSNRLAGRFAKKVFVAFEGMDRQFPPQKVVVTGNPVRQEILKTNEIPSGIAERYRLNVQKPTLLVVGGSLGAAKINETIDRFTDSILPIANLIWVCGKLYYNRYRIKYTDNMEGFYLTDFIPDLYQLYPVADLVISRAGAGTLSELAVAQKACILIPSPNVAENHQYKNAMAFGNSGAAVVVTEDQLDSLPSVIDDLIKNPEKRKNLEKNIRQFARPDATKQIVDYIAKYLQT